MAYSMLGARGLLVVVLGCVGCDAAASEEGADPAQQGLGQQSEEDAGYLLPTPISNDAGHETSLTTRIPTKTDAGVPGDAGQEVVQGDAGYEVPAQGDAGQDGEQGETNTVRILVDPTTTGGLPDCAAVYFRDLDDDGFGDSAAKVTSCTKPAGYVEVAGDCYDNNERAHPNATGQFLQHRGDGSFDYDCDGVETKLHVVVAACPELTCTGLACDTAALEAAAAKAENGGWTVSTVPSCGEQAAWGLNVSWFPGIAKPTCAAPVEGTTRTQTCR